MVTVRRVLASRKQFCISSQQIQGKRAVDSTQRIEYIQAAGSEGIALHWRTHYDLEIGRGCFIPFLAENASLKPSAGSDTIEARAS